MKICKGDAVKVISGNFKGKQGKVLKVFNKNKVQVENVGFYKKHIKSRTNKAHPESGIIEKLSFIDISNVMIFPKQIKKRGK